MKFWKLSRILVLIILCVGIIGFLEFKQKSNPVTSPAKNINIYANANTGMLANVARDALPRVYVPNSLDNTVSVIDPSTYQVVDTFKTGKTPQHVVPSYDLKTLWVANNRGNSLTPIDPKTGKPGKIVPVDDPYNLYFTPDGQFAIVVSEAHKKLNFYDTQTMTLRDSVPVQCGGINHMDFTADGLYALFTCEFTGQLLKLDVLTHKIVGYLSLSLDNPKKHSMPQDIRLAPNGQIFYVADMMMDGVFLIDPVKFTQIGFIPTGIGTHSIYPSRDGKLFYVANRGCHTMTGKCPKKGPGSVTVIDPTTQRIVATWAILGGGSPDMGNVNANGNELWLSGRYDHEVYVFDTHNGALIHRISVGRGPHGLTVWPQPGRYSLGHTGNMR